LQLRHSHPVTGAMLPLLLQRMEQPHSRAVVTAEGTGISRAARERRYGGNSRKEDGS
jgi:hypothetical protein